MFEKLVRRATLPALLLALPAACSNSEDAPAPPGSGGWGPGKVYPSDSEPTERGLLDVRGIIHAHSIYSHDACDSKPFDADGNPNTECFDDLRRGICQVGHQFLMLSDHASSFAENEFPDVLLYREDRGDRLIERNGAPAANWAGCSDGSRALILAGTETGIMPVGLEKHLGTEPAERDAAYGSLTPEGIEKFKEAGAVALVQHTEDWTDDQLVDLPIDGFEMYNLHANMYLAVGEAMGLLSKQNQPELLPHPDLVVAPIIRENPVYLDRWSHVLARGARRVTTLATDCHRNTLWQLLPDGERIDSYRRMMLAFSNHLLVRGEADGTWNDLQLKEALRAGRLYGVFEFLGYARAFDYHADEDGTLREMGEQASVSKTVELRVRRPNVLDLDPSVTPPTVTVRILRATASGWEEVAANEGDLVVPVTEPGAYRAEVRIVPRHLAPYLSSYADLANADYVWIYSNPIYVVE